MTASLTPKGEATRARIVAAAADLILSRGVGGTSLDDIRAGTATSKSQLFHYFPSGKGELVRAIADFQGERVLDAQRPHLDQLDSWASWGAWRDAVVAHYRSQPDWGCPIGSMASELCGTDPDRAAHLADYFARWEYALRRGIERMADRGLIRPDADASALAAGTLAALQGGLLLSQVHRSIAPLEAALDGALLALRAQAA